jgi:hypothetical protein
MGWQRRKDASIAVQGEGDLCPRCRQPMQIREHGRISEKQLRQPFYYSRWFLCCNPSCRTKLVMPPRFQVANGPREPRDEPAKNEHRIDRTEDRNPRAESIKAQNRSVPVTPRDQDLLKPAGQMPQRSTGSDVAVPMSTRPWTEEERSRVPDTASEARLAREREHFEATGEELAPWLD